MKKLGKKVFAFLLVYLGIVALFSTLMIATYWLPNTNIRGHVAESVAQLEKEGIGYVPFFQQTGATLDMHTDALMLNIALNKGMSEEQSTIERAFENSFHEDESTVALSSLQENLADTSYNNHEYSRYWHGNQVIVRPLLLFFNYTEIRYLLMMMIFVLLAIVFGLIGKQLGIKHGIAFAITITLMYIVLIPASLQYSTIFLVTLVGMIAVLLLYRYQKQKFMPILFFVIGAAATFFDLLTYPLVSLGLPLVLAVLLENRGGMNLRQQILFILKLGILWAIGYSLLFFTKWVIASLVLHKDAISLALNEILFRVNGNEKYPVNRLDVLANNINYFFVPTAKYVLAVLAIFWLIACLPYHSKPKQWKCILPLMCIAIVPYVWYILFAGHSAIHCWFTNKIQAMTLFALLCGMAEMIDETKLGSYRKKRRKEQVKGEKKQ